MTKYRIIKAPAQSIDYPYYVQYWIPELLSWETVVNFKSLKEAKKKVANLQAIRKAEEIPSEAIWEEEDV